MSFFAAVVILFLLWNPISKEENILYSWSMDALEDTRLRGVLKERKIRFLYQDFSTSFLEKSDSTFLEEMNALGVAVYHLTGDPSWGQDKDAKEMKAEIDKVVTYNNQNQFLLAGIVFDVEPYLNNRENIDFSLYVEAMKETYRYAHEKGIYMVLAAPVWFDTIDERLLEELVLNGCDELSLMNYNIKYTKERMEEEVEFAKKYKKNINTIYEIDFGKEGYFASYEAIDHDYKEIQKKYKYKNLRKAYHYYAKMK